MWLFIWGMCCHMPQAIYPNNRGRKPCTKVRVIPIWSCSRLGLHCRLRCRTRGGLLPHHFTLTTQMHGGIFSVALSLEFPQAGVTRSLFPVESGLSSRKSPFLQSPSYLAWLMYHYNSALQRKNNCICRWRITRHLPCAPTLALIIKILAWTYKQLNIRYSSVCIEAETNFKYP